MPMLQDNCSAWPNHIVVKCTAPHSIKKSTDGAIPTECVPYEIDEVNKYMYRSFSINNINFYQCLHAPILHYRKALTAPLVLRKVTTQSDHSSWNLSQLPCYWNIV